MINKTFLSVCLSFIILSCYCATARTANTTKGQFRQPAPLAFLENKGQVTDQNYQPRPDIDFKVATGSGLNIFIGDGAIHYQYMRCDNASEIDKAGIDPKTGKPKIPANYTTYRMDVELVGANKDAMAILDNKQDYYENYFTANTGENGITANAWGKITYKDIYPSIDWILYTKNGQLKHEFVVRKGGHVSDIKIHYGGASSLSLNNNGELVAHTPLGSITEHAPYTYQADGKTVASSFQVENDIVHYSTATYEGTLTIDPTLSWATYYGGAGTDWAASVTTDASGNVYMLGNTSSIAGIATSGAHQSTFGGMVYYGDAFLVKFNSSGVRQWATYYGGTNDETVYTVTTSTSGDVYIGGITSSTTGIATAGAHQPVHGGGTSATSPLDGFLAKFNSAGIRQWGTYYGGAADEILYAVIVDDSGYAYICGGSTSSTAIATPGAYQSTNAGFGSYDAFLVKFTTAGTRVWGTYYGGPTEEVGSALAVSGNNIYMTGSTYSTTGIATAGAHQTTYSGSSYDGYLVKFTTAGARVWGTYYGGNNYDVGVSVVTDDVGNVYLAGRSSSTNAIATPGAYQTTFAGGMYDCFLAKFNSAGTRQWGTYYGGPGEDLLGSVTTNCSGKLYISGYTASTTGISTPGSYQPTYGGGSYDCILAEFSGAGALTWGTYYGGPGYDVWSLAACDNNGNLYYVGRVGTGTTGIATPGAHQTTYGGGSEDAFVTKFTLGSIPVAPITGTLTLCSGTSTTLACATSGGTWSSGGTSFATIGSSTGILNGVAAGTATITYLHSGGCKATAIATVDAPPAPGPISGSSSVCLGGTSLLTDTAPGGSWTSDNIPVATVSTGGLVSGVAPGTATITHTITNSCGTAYATKIVTVTTSASAGTITGTATVCVGATTTLTNAVGGGSWSSDNIPIATVSSSGVVNGVAGGTATISYAVVFSCGTAYATAVVTVIPLPSAGVITGTPSVCVGATTTLTDAASGGSWSSGGSAASVSSDGIVSGLAPGTATISYTVTNSCGTAITSAVVTVNALPSAGTITGTPAICPGATSTLTTTMTGGTWSSSSVAIATVTGGGIVTGITYGTTTISYSVTNSCGTAYATVIVTVTTTVSAGTITGSSTVCAGYATTLSDAIAGGTWSSGALAIATVSSAGVVSGVATGTATISYTVSTACGTAYATRVVSVTVSPSPGTITGPLTICLGSTTTLANSVSGGIWTSSNTAVAPVGTASGIVTGTAVGTATISYTVISSCGSANATAVVSVNTTPMTGPITGSANICIGTPSSLADAAGGGTWSSSNTAIATVSSGGMVSGVTTGTATISYIIATSCGTASATKVVTIYPLPAAGTIVGITTICAGTISTLADAAGGGTWSSSNYAIAPVSSGGVVSGITTGTTSITYSVTNSCGTAYTTTTVSVNPLPSAGTVTGPSTVCVGAATTLADATGGGSWSSSNIYIATVNSGGIVAGVAAGVATISYVVTNTCGAASAVRSVTVNTVPTVATITGGTSVCQGATLSLADATPGGIWSSSTANAAISTSGVITGITAGTALISYTLTNACGAASALKAITITPASECETSITGMSQDEISLFPNPSDGTFTLVLPSRLHTTSITLYDLLGRLVPIQLSDGATTGYTKVVVDSVAAGNYILKVITENKIYQRTITIR